MHPSIGRIVLVPGANGGPEESAAVVTRVEDGTINVRVFTDHSGEMPHRFGLTLRDVRPDEIHGPGGVTLPVAWWPPRVAAVPTMEPDPSIVTKIARSW